MRDLLLDLDLSSHKQRGLESALRDAIRSGRLHPGEVLPSSRSLAADLGLARSTVVAAYDQLASEGYLLTRQGASTRVAAGHWNPEQPAAHEPRHYRIDLIPGEPDASQFPRAAWLRSTREVLATSPADLFAYGDPSGLPALRTELARYLRRTRNLAASADAITVVPGAASGLGQLARLLLARGASTIAVEDPGFPFHHAILRREGLRLEPVPVDGEGIDTDRLAATDAAAVLVTPAHQYPLGVVMSAERRASLASWARRCNAWIIEDDYDAEFRYDRHPIGALQGIAADRVAYLGTSSKTLGAGLRVAWLVLPPGLREALAEQRGRDSDVSQLGQATLAHFIARGDLDRHIRRMRTRYRTRRDSLLTAIRSALDPMDVQGVSAGLHLTVTLTSKAHEEGVIGDALAKHNLALWGLRQHYQIDPAAHGLVLGFSRTSTDFGASLTQLAEILRAHQVRATPRPAHP
ncbi:MAG: PLP-dependent aminotransferase family protein [Acidimicrobiales bacterium]